jgi:hypothetical protein
LIGETVGTRVVALAEPAPVQIPAARVDVLSGERHRPHYLGQGDVMSPLSVLKERLKLGLREPRREPLGEDLERGTDDLRYPLGGELRQQGVQRLFVCFTACGL